MKFSDYAKIYKKIILLVAGILCVALSWNISQVQAHTYYNSNITAEQAAQADAIAKHIADTIMANLAYKTDLAKVSAAARWIARYYTGRGKYGVDENKYYRTPYGVFVAGKWTCAGATRALGRVLDFMGYEWTHVNENEWLHQWPVLYMDGKIGYADAAVIPTGEAGYGEYKGGIEMVEWAKANRK